MYYQAWEFIFPRNDIFNDYALAIHFESFALRVIWPQVKQIAEFSTSCLSVFSLWYKSVSAEGCFINLPHVSVCLSPTQDFTLSLLISPERVMWGTTGTGYGNL